MRWVNIVYSKYDHRNKVNICVSFVVLYAKTWIACLVWFPLCCVAIQFLSVCAGFSLIYAAFNRIQFDLIKSFVCIQKLCYESFVYYFRWERMRFQYETETKRWPRHSAWKLRTPSAIVCIQEIFTFFALCEKCGFLCIFALLLQEEENAYNFMNSYKLLVNLSSLIPSFNLKSFQLLA